MRRRRRALAFLLLAALAAAAAAALAEGYGARAVRGYGALRPVVVVGARIATGQRFGPAEVAKLAVRRVPERFAPPGALLAPGEALGLIARAPLPAGLYLVDAQLGVARRPRGAAGRRLGDGRRPVEIAVSAAGSPPPGSRVDVVVTSEPSGAGPGRTRVAARRVPLLALRPGSEGPGGATAMATLGLSERQALRLIAAESFARALTLLPEG